MNAFGSAMNPAIASAMASAFPKPRPAAGGQTVTIIIEPATLPNAQVGADYSELLTATGGQAPYTYSVYAGALPYGIVLDPDGSLEGDPVNTGSYPVTVEAEDSNGNKGYISYTLQVDAQLVELILGTTLAPVNAGSSVNKTSTWAQMQSSCVPVRLKGFEVYDTVAGTVKLKALQPIKGAGLNVITNQTLTALATGVSQWTEAGGTMTGVNLPANTLVGFHTPSSGGATVSFRSGESPLYSAGYLAGTGDLAGNGVNLAATAAYGNELQSRYYAHYTRGLVAPGQYWIDENFAGTIPPAFGVNNAATPWVFTTPGQITCPGTGVNNFYDFFPTTNNDRCTGAVEFIPAASTDRFGVYRRPFLGDASVDDGTIIEISTLANAIQFYQKWTGGSSAIPATQGAAVPITAFTLTVGTRYRAELTKIAKLITLRLINTVTLAEQSFSFDNDPTSIIGLGYGRFGFCNLAGSHAVKAVQFYPAVSNPLVAIVGDSITEGSGTTDSLCFAQLVLDTLSTPGQGWCSGDGGTSLANVLRRLRHLLRLGTPRYVLIENVNNSASDTLRNAYPAIMDDVIATIEHAGAVPVIFTLSPDSDATRNARIQVINAGLLARGIRLVRMDLALSLGNDGHTYNPSVMFDGVHPNATGHALMRARIALDFPEVFIYTG